MSRVTVNQPATHPTALLQLVCGCARGSNSRTSPRGTRQVTAFPSCDCAACTGTAGPKTLRWQHTFTHGVCPSSNNVRHTHTHTLTLAPARAAARRAHQLQSVTRQSVRPSVRARAAAWRAHQLQSGRPQSRVSQSVSQSFVPIPPVSTRAAVQCPLKPCQLHTPKPPSASPTPFVNRTSMNLPYPAAPPVLTRARMTSGTGIATPGPPGLACSKQHTESPPDTAPTPLLAC